MGKQSSSKHSASTSASTSTSTSTGTSTSASARWGRSRKHELTDVHWDPDLLKQALPATSIVEHRFKKCSYDSYYLRMRDGVHLAIDVYLPGDEQHPGSVLQPVPCILQQTRYMRAMRLRWPLSKRYSGRPVDVINMVYKQAMLGAGYAVVVVDVRGTGASFGRWQRPWQESEAYDSVEVIDWIVSQPWSNGSVGLWGISYDGTAAYSTVAQQHPAVKACAPMFMFWDMFADIAHGGIVLKSFLEAWTAICIAMDMNDLSLLPYNPKLMSMVVKGVARIKSRQGLPMHVRDAPSHELLGRMSISVDSSSGLMSSLPGLSIHSNAMYATAREANRRLSLDSAYITSPHNGGALADGHQAVRRLSLDPAQLASPPHSQTSTAVDTPPTARWSVEPSLDSPSDSLASTAATTPSMVHVDGTYSTAGSTLGPPERSSSPVLRQEYARNRHEPNLAVHGNGVSHSDGNGFHHQTQVHSTPVRVHLSAPTAADKLRRSSRRQIVSAAVQEHLNNYNAAEDGEVMEFADDISPQAGVCACTTSPFNLAPAVAASNVPMYYYSAWLDCTATAAILAFRNAAPHGSRLIIGPWNHGGFQHVPLIAKTEKHRFDHARNIVLFFNNFMRQHEVINEQPRVSYFVLGASIWRHGDTWPPPGVTQKTFFLHAALGHASLPERGTLIHANALRSGGGLSTTLPSVGIDTHHVKYHLHPEGHSRWDSMTNVDAFIKYRKLDCCGHLTYTSEPLAHDLELTGHAVAELFVASSDSDAELFVYIQEVDLADNVTYITEGCFKASHRKESTPQGRRAYTQLKDLPWHSYERADAQPLRLGEPELVRFSLMPIAYRFAQGRRIRVAIGGADTKHFRCDTSKPRTLWIHCRADLPSRIVFPVLEEP
eukprot:jgi/Chlat1/4688/Chrsp3S05648